MNSLEALHNFIETKSCINCPCHKECDEGVNCPCDEWERIIKQDLEHLERVRKAFCDLGIDYETLEFENIYLKKENAKLKQVLDILKDNLHIEFYESEYTKNTKVYGVKFMETEYQEYDYTIMLLEDKEEYELLKEVLGNE